MPHERTARKSILLAVITLGSLALCCTSTPISLPLILPAEALTGEQSARSGGPGKPDHYIDRLFSDEMKGASAKLKWHGERLTEDTVYAVALTGASWEPAWGKDRMFSLAWGDIHKVPVLGKRATRTRDALITEVRSRYEAKQYRRLVDYATSNFTLDEISCDVNLKEYVGASLVAMGQPEQAFPIYAAAFDPATASSRTSEYMGVFRRAALDCAVKAGLRKEAVAFSLSLLLDPDKNDARPDAVQIEYLRNAGVDIDRVIRGILQAPERLRGLPAYYYAAADLMAFRASPGLYQYMLQLAESGDVYLRSRAILGLGMVAYQPRSGDPPGWADRIIYTAPVEFGISSAERKLVDREIKEGANSDKYRLRAMAALAMGLSGDPDYVPELQKLAKDKAYVLGLNQEGVKGKARSITFPVRIAASAALYRYGVTVQVTGGVLAGRELDRARHGGSDETNDHRNLRKDTAESLVITPVDTPVGSSEK